MKTIREIIDSVLNCSDCQPFTKLCSLKDWLMKKIKRRELAMLKSICENSCIDRSYSNCRSKHCRSKSGGSGKCPILDLIKRTGSEK